MFLKPNAAFSPQAVALVDKKLRDAGIDIVSEGTLSASAIEEGKLIDVHYGSIAAKAMTIEPKDLIVSPEAAAKFHSAFGVDFRDAVVEGSVLNAKDACVRLGITESELGKRWSELVMGKNVVKFGGGFYCGAVAADLWVINGFYMAMRKFFVTDGAMIRWMCVEWAEEALSWKDFRALVVGATNPEDAAHGSIRRALLDDWTALGLDYAPSTKENGVHASASPLEALRERLSWLHGAAPLEALSRDPFGAELLASGAAAADVERWFADPPVKRGNAESAEGSLFDLLEDRDATDTIAQLMRQR